MKTANNSAMPRVLLEAIQHRSHLGKITWIVDQPTVRLNENHLCYSIEVDHALRDWDKIDLMSNVASENKTSRSKVYRPGKSTSSVFARGQASPQSHTKSVEIEDRQTRKKSSSKSAKGGWKR